MKNIKKENKKFDDQVDGIVWQSVIYTGFATVVFFAINVFFRGQF